MTSAPESFLRGIESRAEVLVQAQAGPALDSAALLGRVRQRWLAEAVGRPLAEWPQRYWSALLAEPALGQAPRKPPSHPLYQLAPTRRMALLLRLVAGIEPAGAARLLGVSETAFRALVSDAEDKLAELKVEPATLLGWQQAFLTQIRDRAREGSVAVRLPPARQFYWGPLQWGLMVLALLVTGLLVATWVWPPGAPSAPPETAAPAPAAQPLEEAAVTPSTVDQPSVERMLQDPDFRAVIDADRPLWSGGVGWWSWWTAQTAEATGDDDGAPLQRSEGRGIERFSDLPVDQQAALPDLAPLWAQLPPATRRDLVEQVARWQGADGATRDTWRNAYGEFLKRSATDRAQTRQAFAAWRRLPDSDQVQLRSAAARFASVPAEQQIEQRTAFEALPVTTQADWSYGPRAAATVTVLRPLWSSVAIDRQDALLSTLLALPPAVQQGLARGWQAATPSTQMRWRADLADLPADGWPVRLREWAALAPP